MSNYDATAPCPYCEATMELGESTYNYFSVEQDGPEETTSQWYTCLDCEYEVPADMLDQAYERMEQTLNRSN